MAAPLLDYRATGLAQERKNTLAGLVCLGQHGGAGLGQDVGLGELDHFLSHVDVRDAGLSGLQVLIGDVQGLDRVLKAVLACTKTDSHLVFTTKYGGSFAKLDSSDNPVAKVFRQLVDRLGLYRPGISFYSLRHIFQTIGDGAKDPVATSHIMGHADRSMAGQYREKIDDTRLEAVVAHVHTWLYAEPKASAKQLLKVVG